MILLTLNAVDYFDLLSSHLHWLLATNNTSIQMMKLKTNQIYILVVAYSCNQK